MTVYYSGVVSTRWVALMIQLEQQQHEEFAWWVGEGEGRTLAGEQVGLVRPDGLQIAGGVPVVFGVLALFHVLNGDD